MDIGKIYNVKCKKVIECENGYILKLSKSKLLLMPAYFDESDIIAACTVIDYAKERGFKNTLRIIKSGDGKPYIKKNEILYVLVDFIDGSKLKLKTRENAEKMGEILARFHDAVEYFEQPPGIKVAVRWGKKMEMCRNYTIQLEKYSKRIKEEVKNTFEEYTLNYVDYLIKRAKASMKILKSIDYLNALEDSMKRREVCLNSISNNTAVINNGQIIIVKVFDIGYNMIEEDVASLIKKSIEETKEKLVFNDILESYKKVRNIDKRSETIIKALVSYPYDSIKTIIRYIKYPEDHNRFFDKFINYVELEQWTDVLEV